MKKVLQVFIIAALMLIIIGLLVYGNGVRSEEKNKDTLELTAKVLEVDDSNVVASGISRIGDQRLQLEILDGKYKDEKIEAPNHLMGKLDMDNYYKKDDIIVVAVLEQNGAIKAAKAVDMYRQGWELVLFGVFVLCLIVYAKITGLKALFSFIASLFVLWRFLIPSLLEGKSPLFTATWVLMLLTAVIMFSVAGFTKKGAAAFIATICGMLVTIGITIFFGSKLGLYGMTMPFAEALLFSGYLDLNMQHIFYAAIIIGASGAAMDIAMDVAASMEEIKLKKPDITMAELTQSGFNVGRSVIGTMTTTLLLAYSGGHLTLLMLFMSKNSSFTRMVNLKIITAEIMRTIVGSIGLVLVAPITALVAGIIFSTNFAKYIPLLKKKSSQYNPM